MSAALREDLVILHLTVLALLLRQAGALNALRHVTGVEYWPPVAGAPPGEVA